MDDAERGDGGRATAAGVLGRLAAAYGRRRGLALKCLAAAAAVLGLGAALVYAYERGRQDGAASAPPIIRAGDGPTRIRPADPGGRRFPNIDKEVLNRGGAAGEAATDGAEQGEERLLPPPEKPLVRPAESGAGAGGDAPPDAGGTAAKPPPAAAPDGKAAARGAAPAASTPPAVGKKPSGKAAKRAARTASAAPPRSKAAARKPAAARTTSLARAYRIQLAVLRSESLLRRDWSALKRRHPDLLGGLSLRVERRTLGQGRGSLYRMQAGPLADRAAAARLCALIKKRRQHCVIVPP